MPSLSSKVALITGSTSGIGFGIASHLASLGATVVLHGRKQPDLDAAVARLRDTGASADAVLADLETVDGCRHAGQDTIARFGAIDVLVNNAADTSRGYLEDAPVEL